MFLIINLVLLLLIILDLYHLSGMDGFRPRKPLLMRFKVKTIAIRPRILAISTRKSKLIFLILFSYPLFFKTLDVINLHILTLNLVSCKILLEEHLSRFIEFAASLCHISVFVNVWHQKWICPILLGPI